MNSLNTGKQNINIDWYQADQNDKVLLVKHSKPTYNDLSTPPSQIPVDSTRLISSVLRDSVESSLTLPPSPQVPLPRVPLNAAPLCHHTDVATIHSSHSDLPQSRSLVADLDHMREFKIDYALTPDVLLPAPRMEPGRIRKEVRFDTSSIDSDSSHHAVKHPYASSAPITPELIPLKRQRTTQTKAQLERRVPLPSSIDSLSSTLTGDISSSEQLSSDPFSYGSNYRDINTIAGSDLVDFFFTNKKLEDIDRLENDERQLRMKQGADAVLTGRMYDIQKDFMNQLMKRSSKDIRERASETASSLMQSVLNYKNSLVERASDAVESAKDRLNMTSMHRSLDAIAIESKFNPEDGLKPNSMDSNLSERVVFAWPRQVPKEIYEAEELARAERIQRGADPMITGRLHLINVELKNKWAFEKPYLSFAKESTVNAVDSTINAVSSVEHAAMNAVGSAVRGTIDAAESLGRSTLDLAGKAVGKVASLLGEAIGLADTNEYLDAKNFKRDVKRWELTRAAEELERTRRVSDSLIDPMIDARKKRVEKELLGRVRSC